MPIETITKAGRRRYRRTFERIIESKRIRAKPNSSLRDFRGRS
jgi:hypothetical protein